MRFLVLASMPKCYVKPNNYFQSNAYYENWFNHWWRLSVRAKANWQWMLLMCSHLAAQSNSEGGNQPFLVWFLCSGVAIKTIKTCWTASDQWRVVKFIYYRLKPTAGRKDTVGIFGVQEENMRMSFEPRSMWRKMQEVKYAERTSVSVKECPAELWRLAKGVHFLQSLCRGKQKFAWWLTSQNTKNVNIESTLMTRLTKPLRQRQDVTSSIWFLIKGVYQANDSKIAFDSLFKLFEWYLDFVYSVCRNCLHFC